MCNLELVMMEKVERGEGESSRSSSLHNLSDKGKQREKRRERIWTSERLETVRDMR